MAHGDAVLHFFVEICTFCPVTGLTTLCVVAPEAFCPVAEEFVPPDTLPFNGDGLSSFDLRFSGRGGKNALVFGEGEGVFELFVVDVPPLDELLVVDELPELVVAVAVPVVDVRPPRPLLPPFLSLLFTELRVSLPFGVLESKSSVGESHNLKLRKQRH